MQIAKRALWVGGLVGAAALLAGGIAFASNKQSGGPPPPPPPGPNPNPPPPQPTGCSNFQYQIDPTGQATAIANSISYHNTPVTWQEGTVYDQAIDGVLWRFVMSRNGDLRVVATMRCMD